MTSGPNSLARPAGLEPATLGLEGRGRVENSRSVNRLQHEPTLQDDAQPLHLVNPDRLTPEEADRLRCDGFEVPAPARTPSIWK